VTNREHDEAMQVPAEGTRAFAERHGPAQPRTFGRRWPTAKIRTKARNTLQHRPINMHAK